MGRKNGIGLRETEFNAEISRRVEELRLKRRVRHKDLARAADVSVQMLASYEVGTTRWPVYRLRLIADYFVVDVDSLLPEVKHHVDCLRTAGDLFVG